MKIKQILQKLPSRQIYMDYAAGAPMLASVRKACFDAERKFIGNPSSIHQPGVASAKALLQARKEIASVLYAQSDEIVFVSGGTESDNLAIRGALASARALDSSTRRTPHIITTTIEHPAVLETCRALERDGVSVTYLPVAQDGLISLADLRAALRPETVLVTICYANSEIGVVQPIKEIAKEIRHFKKISGDTEAVYPLLHTDACQAGAYLNTNVQQLGVDMLSMNGTKLGGPKGIGLLYVRRGTPIEPIITGGGQQSGMRSGSESVSLVIGFALALTTANRIKEKEAARLAALQEFFIQQIRTRLPEARINGSLTSRLPNNINISLPKIASELLVLELDARGISASAGSACSSAKGTGSHSISELYGPDDQDAWGTVRFSLGVGTTKKHIIRALQALTTITKKYENLA